MARIRTIKPEFWTDSKTGTLSDRATKLFIGMMNHSDDFGVLKYDEEELKAKIFPYMPGSPMDVVAGALVQEIIPKRLALPFEWGKGYESSRYLLIVNLAKHQKINEACKPTIRGFTFADVEKVLENSEFGKIILEQEKLSLVREGKVREGKVREGKVRESKGEEGKVEQIAPSPSGSELSVLVFPAVGTGDKTWGLSESKLAEYRDSFPGVDVLSECRKALQWCRDNASKRKTAKGMPAFLTRWLSNQQNSGGRNGFRQQDSSKGPVRTSAPEGKYAGLERDA